MFLAILPHWNDQEVNMHFLCLLVEFCQTERLPSILQHVRANYTSGALLVTNAD